MKFELEPNNRGVSDDELIEDIRRSASELAGARITRAQYRQVGRYAPETIVRRFGSWNQALKLAGLNVTQQKDITDDELLQNIKTLWIRLGRQPRYDEVRRPESQYSTNPYERRFGSWTKSLKSFVEWVNSDDPCPATPEGDVSLPAPDRTARKDRRRTRREPSDRQRFRILVRDGFRCRSCGASPLAKPGVELHVDHILPWSMGAETVDDNLETKCSQCNLGKGNAFNV
jgi:5-methylcytosine-specific restriction endonuclease McrA